MTDKLISTAVNFDETADDLIIEKSQYIPQWHLDQLKADRFESSHTKAGEMHRVASIPVAVHELWLSQGYDCTKEPIKKTIAKLKHENLDAFITSDKV
jgi:hypothetical protein